MVGPKVVALATRVQFSYVTRKKKMMTEADRIEREKFFRNLWGNRTYAEWVATQDAQTVEEVEQFLLMQHVGILGSEQE